MLHHICDIRSSLENVKHGVSVSKQYRPPPAFPILSLNMSCAWNVREFTMSSKSDGNSKADCYLLPLSILSPTLASQPTTIQH